MSGMDHEWPQRRRPAAPMTVRQMWEAAVWSGAARAHELRLAGIGPSEALAGGLWEALVEFGQQLVLDDDVEDYAKRIVRAAEVEGEEAMHRVQRV